MRQVDLFDDYINGQLSEQEKLNFESELNTNPELASAFNKHSKLVNTLQEAEKRKALKAKIKAIHEKEIGFNTRIIPINREETFTRRHGKTLVVAASTALFAVLTTVALLSTGGYLYSKHSNEITELRNEVSDLNSSIEKIEDSLERKTPKPKSVKYAPANFQGSAFALNNFGYVITSYHMVKGADSIFIQNKTTERAHASIIISDAKLDIAILKVENKDITKNWQVPFTIKDKSSDIGEKVFTLGYPRKYMVYGEGSLSSLSGYTNDTSMYQISIPVNRGNSGGPLLDDSGNIIGLVRSKATDAEATGFAVKSMEILSVINQAPDSTKAELKSLINRKNGLRNLKRTEQIKRIDPYIFNVLVYNKN